MATDFPKWYQEEFQNPANLIVELNGKKYLLVELPLFRKVHDGIMGITKKYDCILQSIKPGKGGFFSGDCPIIKVLVPEENVLAFNDEIQSL